MEGPPPEAHCCNTRVTCVPNNTGHHPCEWEQTRKETKQILCASYQHHINSIGSRVRVRPSLSPLLHMIHISTLLSVVSAFLLALWVKKGTAQRTLHLFPCMCQHFSIGTWICTKWSGTKVWQHVTVISQKHQRASVPQRTPCSNREKGKQSFTSFWLVRLALIKSSGSRLKPRNTVQMEIR